MVLLILDDIFADVDFHHSPILKSIFMRSRHYGLGVFSLVQTLTSAPPYARINSDWVILGQINLDVQPKSGYYHHRHFDNFSPERSLKNGKKWEKLLEILFESFGILFRQKNYYSQH